MRRKRQASNVPPCPLYFFSNHFTPGPAADNHIATCAQSHALACNPWALTLLHPSGTATFLLGCVERGRHTSQIGTMWEKEEEEEEQTREHLTGSDGGEHKRWNNEPTPKIQCWRQIRKPVNVWKEWFLGMFFWPLEEKVWNMLITRCKYNFIKVCCAIVTHQGTKEQLPPNKSLTLGYLIMQIVILWWFHCWVWWQRVNPKRNMAFFFFFHFTVETEADNELICRLWLLTEGCLLPATVWPLLSSLTPSHWWGNQHLPA